MHIQNRYYEYILLYCIDEESIVEKLRSILSQLEYTYVVHEWTERGIPFQYHFYVPEILPESGTPFLEREDETRAFKVQSTTVILRRVRERGQS